MKLRWLLSLGMMLGLTTPLFAQPQRAQLGAPVVPVGYLAVPIDATHAEALAYVPQPGDILLYDDFNKFFHFIFRLASTAPPTHTAMVIAREDGSSALLELTGPRVITAKVTVMDVEQRLASYPGVIMVRRIRQPLTSQQSQELTQFARAQAGKSFALGRVLLQATPLGPRTSLGRALFGHTYLNRDRWICSEMVVSACAAAHVLDRHAHCANAVYPHDLAFDKNLDLSQLYHPPVTWLHQVSPTQTYRLPTFEP